MLDWTLDLPGGRGASPTHRPTAMRTRITRAPAPASAAAAERLRQQWSRIAIGDLRFGASPASSADRVHVLTYVGLGELLPADARVTLIWTSAPDAPAAPRRTQPMFSEASLHNGQYAFATELPRDAVAAGRRWSVRIAPCGTASPAVRLPTIERRFSRRSEIPAAAQALAP